ncbi:MAG: hypothetical protein J2P53_11920 [Bradyrhizobiaceae bacterium]|nr:hypothetical protein [Bradyrhizobiaceae bacterium]
MRELTNAELAQELRIYASTNEGDAMQRQLMRLAAQRLEAACRLLTYIAELREALQAAKTWVPHGDFIDLLLTKEIQ